MRWWPFDSGSEELPAERALLPGLTAEIRKPFPHKTLRRLLRAGLVPQATALLLEHARTHEALELVLERGEPDAVLAVAEPIAQTGAEERLEVGREVLRRGWRLQAEALLRPFRDQPPGAAALEGRVLLAEALLGLGRAADARRELELVLAEDVTRADAWKALASVGHGAEETAAAEPIGGGRFVLRRLLGRGGTGRVYLGTDRERGGLVALKLLDVEPTGQSLEGLLYGVRLVAALPPHPHVLPVLDIDPELRLVVGPYLPGGSLQALVGAPLPPERWRAMLEGVALGLGHLHHHGVLHLDLKPANVLLTDRGEPVVSDFSLCRRGPPWPRLGSLDYASPEALLGDPLGPASDVYSLGIVAYELGSGARPFPAGTPLRTGRVRPLIEHRPEFPEAFGRLVERMLRIDPAERPAAAEVLASLRGV
jgi:protein kinase-like protein